MSGSARIVDVSWIANQTGIKTMFYHLKTDIFINATPEIVWSHLTGFSAYPRWNPFLTAIKRLEDNQIKLTAKAGKSPMDFVATIIKEEAPHELRWIGKLGELPGLFTGEHYFILTPQDNGTLLQHGEKFSGILAWLLLPFVGKQFRKNFEAMNAALKATAETK